MPAFVIKVRAVLDLMGGIVVRGVGGKRDQYRPIESQLTRSTDPKDIVRAIQESTGLRDFYVADLDAIQKRSGPDWSLTAWFAAKGLSLWIDCGLQSAADLNRWQGDAARPVIGTETFEDHPKKLNFPSAETPVLSLDTLHGKLLGAGNRRFRAPDDLWNAWRSSGIEDLILMDLARVGSYAGPIDQCEESLPQASGRYEGANLHAAGGVRHAQDLKRLEVAGYHSALVASAIHDGRLSAD